MKYTPITHELRIIKTAARIMAAASARLRAQCADRGKGFRKCIDMTNIYGVTVAFPAQIEELGDLVCVRTIRRMRIRALYFNDGCAEPYTVIDPDGSVITSFKTKPTSWYYARKGGRP